MLKSSQPKYSFPEGSIATPDWKLSAADDETFRGTKDQRSVLVAVLTASILPMVVPKYAIPSEVMVAEVEGWPLSIA
jgi:hypothetical protein